MGPLHRRHARNADEYQRSNEVYGRMRSLLMLLRMYIGKYPRVDIIHYINWDRTIIIDNLFYTRPTDIWQVRKVLRAAKQLKMRVRATAVGHSRSPLYVDEGNIMMDVRDLNRHDGPRLQLNQPNQIRNYTTVTAVTGVIEKELNAFMVSNKVTILAQPLNDVESLGGMVAASTHGSTWDAPTYSGIVRDIRLMDGAGRLRKFNYENHPDIMKAAICNLGMFGIMYDITIEVLPIVKAKVKNEFVKLEDLIYDQNKLRETVTSNFLTEISWFPFNSVTPEEATDYQATGTIPAAWNAKRDQIWLRTINIVNDTEVGNNEIKPATYLPTNGSLSGGSVEGLLRGKAALDVAKSLEQVTYHYLVDAFPVILPPRRGSETSAAFMLNIDNQFIRPATGLQFIIEYAEGQIKRNGSTPLNALLPRFFKNYECDLCPGNHEIKMPDDSGRTLVIDFLAPPAQYGFYPAARKFVERFRNESVRPHWAKRHDNIPGIIQIIQNVYGDNIHHFTRMRTLANVDPDDMFMNTYLLQIFGRNFENMAETMTTTAAPSGFPIPNRNPS
ncbi:hypothetical protein LOTGIDRAFT_159383 [Lottia gigantea]|uniref:FAD-binding PCMH-type domain-containing protein n=1 Tax=Lottia gigantea TaxID=225164 RepID=V4C6U0_LOTGI|nr:hypothetical protein LOTGIDRAFT_159383 [Lottia gigantea]ESO97354.1 hypothetical protein LOTGIDRAFT_159383 [Lottia gigantea]